MRRKLVTAPVLVLLAAMLVHGQGKFITLTVKHNGKVVPAPAELTLSFNEESKTVPVSNGRFEIPPGIAGAESVTVTAQVGSEQIRTSFIHGGMFSYDKWTLVLEDRKFADQFYPLPKKAKERSSCVVEFESAADGSLALFIPNCRSKIAKK